MGIAARLPRRIAGGSLPLLIVLASAPWTAMRCERRSPAAAVRVPSHEALSLASGDLQPQHRVRTEGLRHPRWRRPRPASAKLAARSSGPPARLPAAGAERRLKEARGLAGNGGGHRARDSVDAEEAEPCPGFQDSPHFKRVGEAPPPLRAGGDSFLWQRARDDGSLRIVGSAVSDLDRRWAAFPRRFPDSRPSFLLPDLSWPWLPAALSPPHSGPAILVVVTPMRDGVEPVRFLSCR